MALLMDALVLPPSPSTKVIRIFCDIILYFCDIFSSSFFDIFIDICQSCYLLIRYQDSSLSGDYFNISPCFSLFLAGMTPVPKVGSLRHLLTKTLQCLLHLRRQRESAVAFGFNLRTTFSINFDYSQLKSFCLIYTPSPPSLPSPYLLPHSATSHSLLY